MSLYLRSTLVASTGVALTGILAYTLYKTGAWRPVAVTTIRNGIKAREWTRKRYHAAKKSVTSLMAEARENPKGVTQKAKSKAKSSKDKASKS